VEKCIDALPLLDVNIEAGTLGHEEVGVNDLLNVKIKVKLSQLAKGQESGYVHSRQYPFLKRDEWFLLITDRSLSSIAMVEKLDFDGKEEYVKEFQEKVTRTGPINFVVLLVNDSYKGLDILEKVDLEVTEEREKMVGYKEYEYLKEDLVEIKQTSTFKRTPPEEIKFDDYSEDEGKPEVETDEAELLRRLKRDGMAA